MAALYRAKGFLPQEAEAIAARLFENPERALDTLVREELGLDPDELGSPVGAATGSFVAFAFGAAVPVLPYVVRERPRRFHGEPRSQPCRAVRRRGRREPADGAQRAVLRRAAGRDRCGGGRRHVRRRVGRRRRGGLRWPTRPSASGLRAWSPAAGRTVRTIATALTTTATTRSSSSPRARSYSGCRTASEVVELRVGDRLDLPAGTSHDAVVGPDGVSCLEAHLPAGTLAAVARRAAGTW